MFKYKITACILFPFEDAYIADEVKEDYLFITDNSNPYNKRVECIKKYPSYYSSVEEYNNDKGNSFIDEDADGVYFLERFDK